jgi:hypothetical protein
VLTKKATTDDTGTSKTRIDLNRALILALGDPALIIKNKGLDEYRQNRIKDPAYLTTLVMMAQAHGGEWEEAAKYIKTVYPITY